MSQETRNNYAVSPDDIQIEDQPPLPDYEVDQYFPREEEQLSDDDRSRFRKQYGLVRGYFKSRPQEYTVFQRWLNQARMGTTYDVYLTRTVYLSIVVGVVGALAGLVLTVLLANAGIIGSLRSPVTAPSGIARLVGSNRILAAGFILSVSGFVIAASATASLRYYVPKLRTRTREREIDIVLPHAIVYMYALSHGGMNTFEVIKRVADTQDVYGEVANEFDMVVRDVELFGNDLFTAIRDARNLTPSDNMEQFLDDMISVLDSGSDITGFFENESETYMEEARDEQDDFLETLSILSEIFVVAFVAAPLFLIVTLVVISLLGGEGALLQTYVLVYVGLPLGMVAFLTIVDVLSRPFQQPSKLNLQEFEDLDTSIVHADATVEDDERVEKYTRHRRRREYLDYLRNPIGTIREQNPLLSVALTLPLALVLAGALAATGVVAPGDFGTEPIRVTTGLVVAPLLVVVVPLSVLHEAKRRRQQQIASRFPDTLNILSSANEMGIRLTEAFELVSRWSEGVLAVEMRKVRNDIEWNHDVRRALLSFANRLNVPQVTRTMKLIAEGSRSSGDLSRILSIAAEDTRNRHKITEERRRAMSAYIAIVVIGFLVYLAVVVLIDVSYLTPISQIQSPDASGGTGLLTIGSVDVTAYRTVFFHSAIIQAVGSGLLAGKLADNDILSGLKYSILLVVLTLAIFAFI